MKVSLGEGAQPVSNESPLRNLNPDSRTGAEGVRAAPVRDRAAQPPRWGYWRLAKSAPPWKLAALSLDLEPASIDPDDPATFPDAATFGRFILIDEAIKRRFGEPEHRLLNLSEFVQWAASISLELPPQLRALATLRTPGAAATEGCPQPHTA
jgi:hypothetical protein